VIFWKRQRLRKAGQPQGWRRRKCFFKRDFHNLERYRPSLSLISFLFKSSLSSWFVKGEREGWSGEVFWVFFKNSPLKILGRFGFRFVQKAEQAGTRRPGQGLGDMKAPSVPLFTFQASPARDKQPTYTWAPRGAWGTCFPGLVRAPGTFLSFGNKVSSLCFSSGSQPPPHPPTLTPPRGSFLPPESGPAAGRRRGCFSPA
jgi:hypothetical protein